MGFGFVEMRAELIRAIRLFDKDSENVHRAADTKLVITAPIKIGRRIGACRGQFSGSLSEVIFENATFFINRLGLFANITNLCVEVGSVLQAEV